ncbi:MAG: glycogen/starch synthase [Bacteroidales bacterium]|nr:glycogen/starch synthase [Bacteroidales bacterium]
MPEVVSKESKKVLYVNSEIFPYLPESDIALVGRYLPQGIQEKGYQIRSFMPRYGCVNERRNQLHEVIRLSGMNIVVGAVDRQLVIKVASISSARMQVYFIDNEDYFHRKAVDRDASGNFFADNDERAMFFARGVLETVKKLRWKPDLVHCQGWISYLMPLYLKKVYNQDPIFADSKVVLSLNNDLDNLTFAADMASRVAIGGIRPEELGDIADPTGINLAKLAIRHSDGVITAAGGVNPALEAFAKKQKLPVLASPAISAEDTSYIGAYEQFYDKILA